jgi:D-alanyl-D-alanine carboxypeptidase (penicillin-binding protein 5/6)
MPPRSSVMFLGPNQKLSVGQLLKGLVVDSGNDAAVEIADLVAGSVPAFVGMMNREAMRLGYRAMHFVEPAGISAANVITAREYADFARRFVFSHPDALRDLFSLRELTYPLAENLTDGNHERAVSQSNRNVLLGKYEGVDGLKTGYIDESGYNIAVTAERGGMRLISVILGVPDVGAVSGSVLRASESAALLDYGFQTFTTVRPRYDSPVPVRVWKGKARAVVVRAAHEPVVAVRRDQASEVRAKIIQTPDVEAPVRTGEQLGTVVVTLEGRELARFPLRAAADVDRSGVVRRALDSITLFLRGIHPARPPSE